MLLCAGLLKYSIQLYEHNLWCQYRPRHAHMVFEDIQRIYVLLYKFNVKKLVTRTITAIYARFIHFTCKSIQNMRS